MSNNIKELQKEVDMASLEFHPLHKTSWTEQIGILLSVSHVQTIITALKEGDYWKKRCEAAENYLGSYYDVYSNSEKYKKWQELKNKNL